MTLCSFVCYRRYVLVYAVVNLSKSLSIAYKALYFNNKNSEESFGHKVGEQEITARKDLHIVRGKVSKSEDLPIGAKDSISVMESSDKYKFLGKYENFEQLDMFMFQQAEKEYLRRVNIIWSSPLSVPRKLTASIVFAMPSLEYFMGTND